MQINPRFLPVVFLISLFLIGTGSSFGQSLTVEKIMQEPASWIGSWPTRPYWSVSGDYLYFYWNPGGAFDSDSLYRIPATGGEPEKRGAAALEEERFAFSGWHHGEYLYNADYTQRVFNSEGDLFVYDLELEETKRLTQTLETESSARFSQDNASIIFSKGSNYYRYAFDGSMEQLTNFIEGNKPAEAPLDAGKTFLTEQQELLFEVIREQKELDEKREKAREREDREDPPAFYAGNKRVQLMGLDPSEQYVAFFLQQNARSERTLVQNYVTESGFAEDLGARPKVGIDPPDIDLYVQDLVRDTTYEVDLHQLPGSYDIPAYKRHAAMDSSASRRALYPVNFWWNHDGTLAVVEVRAHDNKDRWLARLHPDTGQLTVLDRQTDDAWVAGPGISWFSGTAGWMKDGKTFFYQSEETGYSHLYTVQVETGEKQAVTSGRYEIFNPWLSRDGRMWYFTSSLESPHVRHFYTMPVAGGTMEKHTSMKGNHQVVPHPDEESWAVLFSQSNRPPELYAMQDGEMTKLTSSPTDQWLEYDWRDPEIIQFEASDGVMVPARQYLPDEPNGAAVLFVHGAGYLQNVHHWWSSYFREYMFHNLLADLGYVVLDVDYRGSAGYGRDWRTAIYRHMGGRDLQDYVDASQHLAATRDIDPERVFIYGGSYGGFITLMALFTEPEHFGGGAALRSVTDWAHYNHRYTANILNTPAEDSLAFARSSPIYFAEGLEDPLLIAHGMIDTNVQFQDVVRLAQRLIELGKEDWEMAVYPVEGHGFTVPSSWTDEYRRILQLIEKTVGPSRE